MVMTILEVRVSQQYWEALEQAYQEATEDRPPGFVQSYLLHSTKDPGLWWILTIWSSQEALDAMRGSRETPRGVLLFRNAKAEPSLSVFQVAQQIVPEG